MALQYNDLPEAAKAIRLADAYRKYAMEQLFGVFRYTRAEIRAGLRFHFFGSPGSIEGFVLREFSEPGLQLTPEARQLNFKMETGFVHILRYGKLSSWAREASPLAPQREIPPSGWTVLWPDDLHKGIVKGPACLLFDVRVGRRTPVPPLPATGAPGRPSFMHLVEAEFDRRRQAGETLPILLDEAGALVTWFKSNNPDKQAMTAKTIANRLRHQHREWARESRSRCPKL